MAKKQQPRNAAKAIQSKKQPRKQNAVARAPTSQSARQTTQGTGTTHDIQVLDVTSGHHEFILHCGNLPWLKGVAPSFQKWSLKNIQVRYEPRVSTATNGVVVTAFSSDFQDGTPTTFAQVSNIAGATRAAVWDSHSLRLPNAKAKDYCSLSSFQGMSSTDKNDRAIGRIFAFADMDPSFGDQAVAGRIYVKYTAQLTGPIDPGLQ